MDEELRIITWNVRGTAKSGARAHKIAKIASRQPDIVALQEVSFTGVTDLKQRLAAYGLPHFERFDDAVLATRLPILERLSIMVPDGSALVSARLDTSFGPLEVHCVHVIPGETDRQKKIDTFKQMAAAMQMPAMGHRILCGDFNSPNEEDLYGVIIPFGYGENTPIGKAQCAAERSVLEGLMPYDLTDVWRTCYFDELTRRYRSGIPPYSWEHSTVRKDTGVPTRRRFDHIFASASLNAQTCQHHHAWIRDRDLGKDDPRNLGCSDHAAVEVVFKPVRLV
jgi:endonuclease/exonuclease/phosphatase family metal-dependent hydrolase